MDFKKSDRKVRGLARVSQLLHRSLGNKQFAAEDRWHEI